MSVSVEPSFANSVEARRALVAERLRKAAGRTQARPLSFAQERLWFLDQLEPNSPLYNISSVVRLSGTLDVSALQQSLNAVVARHEILRARFISNDGEPAQVIDQQPAITLECQDFDWTGLNDTEGEAKLTQRLQAELKRPFNLGADRLLRATLLRLKSDEHLLIVNMHHIISDEWSFHIFFRELAACYRAFHEDKPVSLPRLPIQYGDYAVWQREWLRGAVYENQLQFWKEQLSGNPRAIELPTDYPRSATRAFNGAVQTHPLDKELSLALKELANRQGVTLFMLMLAAFKTLLYRYTGQTDIIVGSPIAGRNQIETEELIGFFVNTLPLRTKLSGNQTFEQLLHHLREVTLGAYSHQDLPFEKIVEALQPERALNQTPFINLLFWVQKGHSEAPTFPGLEMEFIDATNGTAKFDLTFAVSEGGEGLVAGIEYNTDLFEPATIARFFEHYQVLLHGIVAQPAARLSDLPLLTATERRRLLIEWNETQTEYPRDQCVPELFEEQARKNPDAVAVVFGQRHLTYRDLNARANQLAHYLKSAGVQPGMKVAVCLERSLEMIVGLLGILKAGAAYAALDPALPKARLHTMLEDLQPKLLLTQRRLLDTPPPSPPPKGGEGWGEEARSAHAKPVRQRLQALLPARSARGEGVDPALFSVCLDSDWKLIAAHSADDLPSEIGPDDLAYVSFTSGSTGRPKGVCVPHRGIVRLVRNTDYASFSPNDVFLQLAPISFDASTFEIWGSLLNGARLIVGPPHIPSLSEITALIEEHAVTIAWFTSGFFNQMVDEQPEGLQRLRQILTGGEALSQPHIKKAVSFLGSTRLVNGYGPTENTTFTTCYPIPAAFSGDRSVPIGRPISNTTCYVLDEHLQPVPIGVPGELYAGGDGLALGYLNAPELTAEKFIPNPFEPGSRLYKTGDIVRYLADGNIEFIGRKDFQVKIRGFRVELGEIESVLSEHPGVRQCAIVARADAAGAKQLAAYFVAAQTPSVTASELRAFLEERLPDYMVPAFVVPLKELPLSANGKVDRRALPPPSHQPGHLTRVRVIETGDDFASEPCARGLAFAEARDDFERRLQDIWEQILDIRPIGIHDHFFALGGHSLMAVRLLALIEKRFGAKLKVPVIFQNPTIEQLAVVLRGRANPASASAIVEIQPHGSKPPLFLVHGAGGGMFWGYNNLARHLDPNQPVLAFKSRGLEGQEEMDTIEALAEAYLADLRVYQPHGPYYLGGYCFGGVVAYEMACRLHRQAEEVALLALLNSSPPNSSYTQFRWTPITATRFTKNLFLRCFYSLRSHPEKIHEFLRWKLRSVGKRLGSLFAASRTTPAIANFEADDWIDLSQYPEDQRRVWQKHLHALLHYQPPTYAGRVTLFRTPVHLLYCSFDPEYGWGELALGGVTVKVIHGAHETLMEEPGVQALATHLTHEIAGFTRSPIANRKSQI